MCCVGRRTEACRGPMGTGRAQTHRAHWWPLMSPDLHTLMLSPPRELIHMSCSDQCTTVLKTFLKNTEMAKGPGKYSR